MTEQQFKAWLEANAHSVLERVGIAKGHTVLDYGCGTGVYTIPAARIVGATSTRLASLSHRRPAWNLSG